MKILALLSLVIYLVRSQKTSNDLKVDYYVNNIEAALKAAQTYQPRKNNSDLLGNTQNSTTIDYGEFDFIVVGSGSSGSAFAARMSEIAKFNILLLEAGEFDDDLTKLPYLSTLFEISDRNWGYFSTPQQNACLGWKNRQCSFPQGKILGGSGTIDFLTYIRGNKADYDKWASLGNPGWSFNDVLPFFKKLENYQSDHINMNYRGFGGPVDVAYKIPMPNFTISSNAYSEIGIATIEDYNAQKQIGVSRIQRLTHFGERVSGSTAYVRRTFTRYNFNVTLGAFVTKILINNSTKTASGVEFVKRGITYRATARKEVIISAGVVNTPQLLMLSGIGPSNELSKHKIPVIADLPVGRGLRGNVYFDVYFSTNNTVPLISFEDGVREFLKGRGYLTGFQNSVSISFMNTRNNCTTVPNVELTYYAQETIEGQIPALINFIPEVEKFASSLNLHKDVFFEISLLHPKSRGNITLKSSNPSDFPNVNLGMFEEVDDIEVLYESAQIAKALLKTNATKYLNATLVNYDFCSDNEYDSKPYWYCAIKHVAYPSYHWSSSVKMGPKDDPNAVVDNKLRVYGIKKLRIVDRSAVPITLSGTYNPSALMIGEKAADMIKKEYGVST
ncbi:hypothetical protein WA026_009993 [Henosepilachna vigintioctopunctata]|uniref:Glucose dehydrogenase [FAD, quinone]-like n=1 Tax=Henosepilachna vigintioctopunctata TaxID=420089 RepID=A0AAW1TQU8_9CUCU